MHNDAYEPAAENAAGPSAETGPSISEARKAANIANSKLSTGPKTAEGKRRSSLNATRSHLHCQIACLPAEELAVYEKLLNDVVAEYQPVGPTESFYASSAAQSMWRLQHLRALEQGVFANGHREKIDSIDSGHHEVDNSLAAAQTFIEHAKSLALLSTYEGRIRRTLEKDLAALKALQAERKAALEKAAEQATVFLEYSASRGERYEPGSDFTPASDWGGFDFSEEDLFRRWDRQRRYQNALHYRRTGKDRAPKPDSQPKIDMAA